MTHSAAWTEPLSVGDLRQWGVQAVNVIGWRAGVTAQQLSSIFTHATELHVIIFFFLSSQPCLHIPDIVTLFFKVLKVFFLCFPLDPFFLLKKKTCNFITMKILWRNTGTTNWKILFHFTLYPRQQSFMFLMTFPYKNVEKVSDGVWFQFKISL